MEKIRVYELSKQLNTTSKRLMEKLKEIDIEVKNHMSLLNEKELSALYDHIGIIRQEKREDGVDGTEKKVVKQVKKADPSKEVAKEKKSIPRIIRKVEIIVDEEDNLKENEVKEKQLNQSKNKNKNYKNNRNFVKRTDENSGLRMGFVRDKGLDFAKIKKNEDDKSNSATTKNVDSSSDLDNKKKEKNEKNKKVEKVVMEETFVEVLDKKENINKSDLEKSDTAEVSPVQNVEKKKSTNHFDRSKVNKKPYMFKKDNQGKDKQNTTGDNRKDSHQGSRPANMQNQNSHQGNRPPNMQNQNTQQGNRQNYRTANKQNTNSMNKNDDKKPYRQFKKPGNNMNTGDNKKVAPLNIPKPDITGTKKDVSNVQRTEHRKEFPSKETEVKKERKEIAKVQQNVKKNRVKIKSAVLGEKIGVTEVLTNEFVLEDMFADHGGNKNRNKRKPLKSKKQNRIETTKNELKIEVLKSIKIGEVLTVKELAETMKKTATEVIKKFMGMGLMVTLNEEVDFDTAAIVAEEFGITAHKEVVITEEEILFDDTIDDEEDLEPRPPVVTVMGHVDHGKTSLLDAIRETNIIEKEAGGITQHIGAYTVKIHDRTITFLDTPGHEAFTSMRARGAQVTDIAVLVVAADDGIMPQTIEAINHAKAANVSIIVAINKIDKAGANPDRVKQDLTSYGLVPEEWGGDIICVPVSAKEKLNIPQLLEMILLSADVLELKASKNKQAKGSVIEARLDKNRGPVATVLVQRGTLRTGDTVVSGSVVGRVRAMTNDKSQNVSYVGPSTPVEILGLPSVPEAGETFYVVKDEKIAKQLVEKRRQKSREQSIRPSAKVSLDDLFNQIKEGKVKELNIIVRADVQGSVEAVKQSIEKLSNEEVRVKIVHGGVGAITKSDVILAEVSNAIIIGFNVRPSPDVIELSKTNNVDIRLYRIIYKAIEDIQAAMKGMLDPKYKEKIQGHTQIRQLFKVSNIGTIGGCYVLDGKITRNSEIRIVRDGVVVHEGKLSSLKRFKDDAKEVSQGYECGLSIEKFNDLKEGDIVESYEMVKVDD